MQIFTKTGKFVLFLIHCFRKIAIQIFSKASFWLSRHTWRQTRTLLTYNNYYIKLMKCSNKLARENAHSWSNSWITTVRHLKATTWAWKPFLILFLCRKLLIKVWRRERRENINPIHKYIIIDQKCFKLFYNYPHKNRRKFQPFVERCTITKFYLKTIQFYANGGTLTSFHDAMYWIVDGENMLKGKPLQEMLPHSKKKNHLIGFKTGTGSSHDTAKKSLVSLEEETGIHFLTLGSKTSLVHVISSSSK